MWKRRIVNRIRDDEETSLSGTTWKRLTGGSIVSQEPYGRAGLSGTMWERLSYTSEIVWRYMLMEHDAIRYHAGQEYHDTETDMHNVWEPTLFLSRLPLPTVCMHV